MEKFREFVNCRLCGSNDYEIVYEWPSNFYDHQVYETASWDGRQQIPLKICQCKVCGLAYSNPSFREEFLNLVYPDDLIPAIDTIKSNDDFIKLFNNHKYHELYKISEKFLNSKQNIILDIGTRYGGLPYYFRKQDKTAYGLELNKNSVQLARKFGLDYIFEGKISDLNNYASSSLPGQFNCIILDDVLEHLVNPLSDIEVLANFQQKGDIIIMRQMNWNSLGHKLFGKSWYYLQPAAHMAYFSPKSAGELLNKIGYSEYKVYLPNLLFNATKSTITWSKNKFVGKKIWKTNNGKTMYLYNRKKSINDMFVVVGIK